MSSTPEPSSKPALPPDVLEFFRKTGAQGGAARKALSFEERSKIAKRGVATRQRKQREKQRRQSA
jgi:hypothetical protein